VNALEACQQLHLILGMGSRGNTAKPGTVPTTMLGQVDELAEIVQWVIKAWTNFQTMQNWGWLHQRGALVFGAGVSSVQPKTAQLTNYREWTPFVGTDGGGGRKYVLSYTNEDLMGSYGSFDSDTGWGLGLWTIASGVASIAGAATGPLSCAVAATPGVTYTITYTVRDRTAGSVAVSFGGATGTSRSANGTYTDVLTATTNAILNFTATAATLSLDDVSAVAVSASATVVQQPVYFLEYQAFRGLFDRQTVATGRPTYFTIGPDQTWYVYPMPDASYTLLVDYLSKPQILTTSNDTVKLEDHPGAVNSGLGLPAEFHEVVVWMAARYWAETRNKADLFQVAQNRVRELMIPIRQRYLPTAFC